MDNKKDLTENSSKNSTKDPTEEEILECCCGVYTITLNHSVYIGSCECSFIEEYNNIKDKTGTNSNRLLLLGGEFTPVVAMPHYDEKRLKEYLTFVENLYESEDYASYTIVH